MPFFATSEPTSFVFTHKSYYQPDTAFYDVIQQLKKDLSGGIFTSPLSVAAFDQRLQAIQSLRVEKVISHREYHAGLKELEAHLVAYEFNSDYMQAIEQFSSKAKSASVAMLLGSNANLSQLNSVEERTGDTITSSKMSSPSTTYDYVKHFFSSIRQVVNYVKDNPGKVLTTALVTQTAAAAAFSNSSLQRKASQENSIGLQTAQINNSLLDNTKIGSVSSSSTLGSIHKFVEKYSRKEEIKADSLSVRNAKRTIGQEFTIAPATADQIANFVTSFSNGNFLVAWTANGDNYAFIFDSQGNLVSVGSPIRLNEYTTDIQSFSTVTELDNGNFVAVWHSHGQDSHGYGVYGQLFNTQGLKIGSEFQINITTYQWQYNPSVTKLANGNLVVTWTSGEQDGSDYGVYMRIFKPEGSSLTSLTGELLVNTYTLNQQGPGTRHAIANLDNGNFIITWSSRGQDGSGHGIYGQIFTGSGTKVGDEFQVNTFTTGDQHASAVVSLSNGSFVIAWNSNNQDNTIGNSISGYYFGIYAQLFNTDGTKIGNEFRVNTYTTNDQHNVSMASLSNGRFVIAWESYNQDGSGYGIYAQVFNSLGNKIGNEFQVNTYILNDQASASITKLPNDNIVLTWTSAGQQNNDGFTDVYGKIIDTHLTATNTNQAIIYTEDTPYTLAAITVAPPVFISDITVTLTLSDPRVGSLLTRTSGNVTSTYNSITGIWQAKGASPNVNNLLANLQFQPALNASSNCSIAVNIDDGFNAPLTDTIILQGTPVNDPPVLVNNALTIKQGQTLVLTANNLSATDVDNAPSTLTFIISNLQRGRFERSTEPGVAINSFTQQEITNGIIQLVQDGSNNIPFYTIQVSDGVAITTPVPASVTFMPLISTQTVPETVDKNSDAYSSSQEAKCDSNCVNTYVGIASGTLGGLAIIAGAAAGGYRFFKNRHNPVNAEMRDPTALVEMKDIEARNSRRSTNP